jgi:hypothetical protein
MHFTYSVYGLQVYANRPIPGLVPLPYTAGIDLQVWLQSMPLAPNEMLEAAPEIWFTSPDQNDQGTPNLRVWKLAGGIYFKLHYGDGTEFIVDRMGTQVWSIWPDNLSLEDAVVYFLGPVLGFVLRLRGTTCLHASAISVGDQAIVLLGPAGAGKSTTAAALARFGCRVLTDDVVALSDENGTFWVQPGYPHLRLWPTSVNMLYGTPDVLPRLVPSDPSWDKRYLNLIENNYKFQHQALPLAAIYHLGERCLESAAPFVETIPASAGIMALVANTSANNLLDKAMREQEFDSLGRIVDRVPIRRVIPHADPAYLSNLCHVILDDFHFLTDAGLTTAAADATLAG